MPRYPSLLNLCRKILSKPGELVWLLAGWQPLSNKALALYYSEIAKVITCTSECYNTDDKRCRILITIRGLACTVKATRIGQRQKNTAIQLA